jgi:hypothetical protein
VFTCALRNLSPTGALLVLPAIVGTPPDFEVCIDSTYRSARVVWRSKMNLGVAWTSKGVRIKAWRTCVIMGFEKR